jgi:hypothetical protein
MEHDLPGSTSTITRKMVQTPSLNIGYEQSGPEGPPSFLKRRRRPDSGGQEILGDTEILQKVFGGREGSTSTNPVPLLSSIANTVSDSLLRLSEKDTYPLSLLKHFATVGINEGNITGLLIPPHQIPDRGLKPVGVSKRER